MAASRFVGAYPSNRLPPEPAAALRLLGSVFQHTLSLWKCPPHCVVKSVNDNIDNGGVLDRLHSLLTFLNVMETRSFSATARAMGVTTSAVSATVIRLEQKLAVRLLDRTTRSVSPTLEGRDFYERCKHIVAALDQAEQSVSRAAQTFSGMLRISAPSALGRMWIIPKLSEFKIEYPLISFEVILHDYIWSVSSQGIDAAIQVGDLPSSRLTARKLASVDYVLCAAPAYFTLRKHPQTPADLAAHHCLAYRRPRNGQIRQWRLAGVSQKEAVPEKDYMTFNSGEGLVAAAASGLGIIQIARYYVQPLLDTGALVEVLPEQRVHAHDISVVFQQSKRMVPRLRVFIDFLVDMFSLPTWDKKEIK